MRRESLIAFLTVFWLGSRFAGACFAEEAFPSPEEILRAEKRGREIAEYERVAVKATDMLLGQKTDPARLGVYVADKSANTWRVYFGRFSEEENKFDAAYEYSCPENSAEQMKAAQLSEISAEITQRARAAQVALKSIEFEAQRPFYNTSVFREEDGTLTVYLMPGNKNPDVVLLGGDFKISLSKDGAQVINKVILHRTVLEIPITPRKDKHPGAFHTHILNDMPSETDVALVILNPLLSPHSIIGREWFSQIDKNGKITILGNTKEILLN